MSKKPVIRVLRHLARSGGTLLGKCIGCMNQVTLLSEIHPDELRVTNPMMQAHQWFGLITDKDLARWKVRPPNMLQFVSLCEMRAKDQGNQLVLRDWSHMDYVGIPYAQPKYGFRLAEALQNAYTIKVSVTVRHPIDQYLSLLDLKPVSNKLSLDHYLKGCLSFAKYANEHGYSQYEEFTKNPDSVLNTICNELDIEFDPTYKERWFNYKTITGDTHPGLGRGSTRNTIEHFGRKEVPDELLKAFREHVDYQQTCELLNYEP